MATNVVPRIVHLDTTCMTLQHNSNFYQLQEVTVDELFKLRLNGGAGLVAKYDGKYYYMPMVKEISLARLNTGTHLCGECGRCRAGSDSHGGCEKVRDHFFVANAELDLKRRTLVTISKRIEKYDFVTEGWETFNCTLDDRNHFTVTGCTHFRHPNKKVVPADKKNEFLLDLSLSRDSIATSTHSHFGLYSSENLGGCTRRTYSK